MRCMKKTYNFAIYNCHSIIRKCSGNSNLKNDSILGVFKGSSDNPTDANNKLPKEFQNDRQATLQVEQEQRENKERGDSDIADIMEMQTSSALYENAIMEKYKGFNKKGFVGNVMDRLAEFHVQQAISRGELSNLRGEGKPLELPPDYNPLVDKATHLLNRVLINNGFAPDWIMLAKDIRQRIKSAREDLLMQRTRAGTDLEQSDAKTKSKWRDAERNFRHEIEQINDKIHQLNLITPILQQQMYPFDKEKEFKKILDLYAKLSASENLPEILSELTLKSEDIYNSKGHAKNIWKDIKSLFKSTKFT